MGHDFMDSVAASRGEQIPRCARNDRRGTFNPPVCGDFGFFESSPRRWGRVRLVGFNSTCSPALPTSPDYRPSGKRLEERPPSSLGSCPSLVLQPHPPDDASRHLPDKGCVRPNLERRKPLSSGFARRSPLEIKGRGMPVWLASRSQRNTPHSSPEAATNTMTRLTVAFRPSS